MRPIKLEMQAFGSYLAPTVIDFERLGKDALFLIHGATGSGKSMIMDAMVYALYGETRFSEKGTVLTDIRHSLAKATDQTYVKFTFSLGNTVYQAERSLKLPKSERGTIKHEFSLFNVTEGEKIKNITRKKNYMAELLGFNANQFKQVILLPQGKFRELLVAPPKNRGDMLTEIFKTAIYGQISIALREEVKRLTKDKDDLESRKKELLANEESAEIINEKISEAAHKLDNFEREKALLTQQRDQAKQEYDRAVQLKKNIEDLNMIRQEQQEKARLAPAIELEQELLKKGEKADLVKAYYDRRNELAHQSAELKERVKKQLAELNAQEEQLQTAQQRHEAAQQTEGAAKEYRAQETRLAQDKERLERLMGELEQLKGQYQAAEAGLGRAKAHVEQYTEAVVHLETRQQTLATEKHNAELAAANEPALKLRIEKLEQEQALLGEIDKLADQLKQLEETKQKQEVDLTACEAAVQKLRQDLAAAQELFHQGQAGFLAKSLAPEKPCPVCGSLHHPRPAKLSDTIPDKKELETKQQALDKSEQEFTAQTMALNNLTKDMENRRHSLAEKQAQLPADSSADKLISELEAARKDYGVAQTAGQKMAGLEKNIQTTAASLLDNQAKLKEVQTSYDKQQQDMLTIKSRYDDKVKELPEGDKTLEKLAADMRQCKDRYTALEKDINAAKAAFEQASQAVARTKASLDTQQEQDARLDGDLAKASQEYEAKRQASDFPDEGAYLAIMDNELVNTPAAREKLKSSHEEYKTACIKLAERAAALEKAIGQQELPNVAALKAKADEAEGQLQDSLSRAGAAQKTLRDLQDKAHRLQEIEARLQAIYKEYEVAGTLSAVANGEKAYKVSFQKYVLRSLMYDVLAQANQRLKVMSRNQYTLLQRADGDGLSIEVFDNYMGSNRPVESLSGGESFLASLAMALGLADVIQNHSGGIRLDAMFIDEGFGTLDPETLDIAMKALLKLRDTGRMIGIVSHVEGLKERIDKRIEVKKEPEKGSCIKIVC